MRSTLIAIGNSRGIRIPKSVIEQCGLTDEVDLQVRQQMLIVRSAKATTRRGWDKAFARMRRKGDDKLLFGKSDLPTQFDREEWTW